VQAQEGFKNRFRPLDPKNWSSPVSSKTAKIDKTDQFSVENSILQFWERKNGLSSGFLKNQLIFPINHSVF
jgi:hypothetical protein